MRDYSPIASDHQMCGSESYLHTTDSSFVSGQDFVPAASRHVLTLSHSSDLPFRYIANNTLSLTDRSVQVIQTPDIILSASSGKVIWSDKPMYTTSVIVRTLQARRVTIIARRGLAAHLEPMFPMMCLHAQGVLVSFRERKSGDKP